MRWIGTLGVLAIRLAGVALYPWLASRFPQWSWSNNDGYDAIALHWIRTGTFSLDGNVPTAQRLPLYPAILAVCHAVFGSHHVVAAMGLQALLSAATAHRLFGLARRLFGTRVAITTVVLFALHPQANVFVVRCATETLFTFLVTAILHDAVEYARRPRAVVLLRAAAAVASPS